MATSKRTARARRGPTRRSGSGKASLLLDPQALRYWRIQRGFTQEGLSRQRAQIDGALTQISLAQLRRIEKEGRAGPGSARTIAALLGVELAQLRPRDSRQLPCGLPRNVSVDFVGRTEEVAAVLTVLGREGNVRIAASVEGLPGIGKTELALQVCGHCERSRTFRIFWFDAENPDLTEQWADVVAPRLGIEHRDQRERAVLAVRALEALGEPILLVLDNLGRWSASEPWPRPQGQHVRWLVTTRQSRLGERAFEHVEVSALDEISSVELMTRIAGPALAERGGFRELVIQLGGYTIAVELAAAFLGRFPEVSPKEYLETIAQGKSDLLEGEVRELAPYQQTLESALELHWNRLPSSSREALVLAACFAQAPASYSLSDRCSLDRRRRAQLRDFHLIQNEASGWSMHRLIRAFALRWAEQVGSERAHSAFVRGCAAQLESASLEAALAAYVDDRPHFELALQHATMRGDAEPLADLRSGIAEALDTLGASEGRQELAVQAATQYRDQLRPALGPLDRQRRARVHLKLARALCATHSASPADGELNEAEHVCEAALRALSLAEEPLDWANAQRLKGRIQQLLEARDGPTTHERAIEAYRAALQVYTHHALPMEWARTQHLLGRAWLALGNLQVTLDPLREAASAFRASLEVLSRDTHPFEWCAAQSGLGGALLKLASQQASAEVGHEAVRVCSEVLDFRDRSATPGLWAQAQLRLGEALFQLGRVEQSHDNVLAAAAAYRAALQELDGESRAHDRARAHYGLASALTWVSDRGKAPDAATAYEEAAGCMREVLEYYTVDVDLNRHAEMKARLGFLLCLVATNRCRFDDTHEGLELCRAASTAVSIEQSPLSWANCQLCLAYALLSVRECGGPTSLLTEASHCFEQAASIFSEERHTLMWKHIQDNLREVQRRLAQS